ncbi:MAG: LacI family transcriptional regulator [Anaerolineae bacterium]|nr:LacI family transcriptional regulator [Anaerolineae bacterium]MDW8171961.1 LacI family DNA-binding transcriptional regulator [Anaerolineae bacterium]
MANLQDVAKRAGVSIATVSKVISNTPYVAEATRQKVLDAIQELGYRPNLAARALSSGKTHIVAVVFPYVYDALFKDPLVLAILEGVESVLNAHKYNLLLSTPRLSEDGIDESYFNLLESGYVDGLIAIDSVPLASVAQAAQARKLPTVVIGYHEAPMSVRCDDFQGGALLMEHLLGLGHRQIGVISVPKSMNLAVNQRLRGMAQVCTEHGVDFEALPIVEGDFSNRGGAQAAEHLLSQHPQLSALVCVNDRMALGAIQRLQQLGLRIPEDVSVVGYDNLAQSEFSGPPLTTINQHAVTLGQSAAEMLFLALAGQQPAPRVLAPTLVVRQSTAQARPHLAIELTRKE